MSAPATSRASWRAFSTRLLRTRRRSSTVNISRDCVEPAAGRLIHLVCGARRGPNCACMEKRKEELLIVGLGNPEADYADTRHNFGFACVRELARRMDVKIDRKRWQSLVGRSESRGAWFVLPQTYINLSGEAGLQGVRDTQLHTRRARGRHFQPDPALG